MRAVVFLFSAVLLALPLSARAFCLLACDTVLSDPEAATAAFERALGLPLPDSVIVEHILQGGFQDKFIQVRITTDQSGADALLPLLGLPASTITLLDPGALGPSGPKWWQPQAEVGLFGGTGQMPGYAQTTVGFAPFPGTYDQVTIYVFAFQT